MLLQLVQQGYHKGLSYHVKAKRYHKLILPVWMESGTLSIVVGGRSISVITEGKEEFCETLGEERECFMMRYTQW